jgi:Ca2+-binding RTX toxin-like protein
MAVVIDFGDFAGVNMGRPLALGGAVFRDFDTFNFTTGGFTDPVLQIPNTSNPASRTAYVLGYGNWGFNPDGSPTDSSTVFALEVWVPGASPGTFAYRIVMDGFNVFFPTFRDALLDGDLRPLYAGQELEILGTKSFSDTLVGGTQDDGIFGYGGHDVLIGNGGNDTLDGMGGRDTMTGGNGHDDYVVNHIDDVISEVSGGGIDLAVTSIDYTLPQFVEDLAILRTAGALDGTGNAHRNFMAGNASVNTLQGLAGDDTLVGIGGDDVLEGGDDDDSLVGGNGNDTLLGGSGNDTIHLGAGDLCDGGAGTDTLRIFGNPDLRDVGNDRLLNIERIDLRIENHRFTLTEGDVLAMSPTGEIKVLGDRFDTVNIVGIQSTGTPAGARFTSYTIGAATLIIDSDIQVL